MIINRSDYRNRLVGCWMGKNIGGTLGAPFEWNRQVNNVSFYTLDLSNGPPANDDLDIQLLWLRALEMHGDTMSLDLLAHYYQHHMVAHYTEYGIAKANLAGGIPAPLSGDIGNVYRDSCGAYIRSEIWASAFPGNPAKAAELAAYDGCIDHGTGEGTYGEIFFAALESALYVLPDIPACIDIALSYLPPSCGMYKAIRSAISLHKEGADMLQARDALLAEHRGARYHRNTFVSEADMKKGYHTGRIGYQAPLNCAITVYSILFGGDDFEKTICTATNMGEDTDCTAATAGAIWGIRYGIDAIPEKWTKPIGRNIITICINRSEHMFREIPNTIDELSDRTEQLALRFSVKKDRFLPFFSETEPTSLSAQEQNKFRASTPRIVANGPQASFDHFTAICTYPDGPLVTKDSRSIRVKITLDNTSRQQAVLNLRWHLPAGWRAENGFPTSVLALPHHLGMENVSTECIFFAPETTPPVERALLEITEAGTPYTRCLAVPLISYSAPENDVVTGNESAVDVVSVQE